MDGTHLRTRPDPKRLWTVRRAIEWGLGCRRLAGWVWEVVLGHATFLGLVDRNSLSACCSIYRWIRANYHTPAPLWKTAAAELRAYANILPVLTAEWTAQWSPTVFATDASEEGCGVCSSRWDRGTVARVGRLKERSRFRRGAGHSARDSFFQAAGFKLGDDGQWTAAKEGLEDEEPADEPVGRSSKEGQWFTDDSFPEVPYEELDERKGEVVMAQP